MSTTVTVVDNSRRGEILLAILLSLSGCAHRLPSPESLVERKVAGIAGRSRLVGITEIDGKSDEAWLRLYPGFLRSAELPPGERILTACYRRTEARVGYPCSSSTFKFVAEPGRLYLIEDDAKDKPLWRVLAEFALLWPRDAVRLRIVDSESGKIVGELLESEGEPVRDDTRFDFASMFSWTPSPRRESMELSRRKDGLVLRWKGENRADSYAVSIRVHTGAPAGAPEDFFSHARSMLAKSRAERNLDLIRDLEEQVEAYGARADCVNYRHASLIRTPRPFAGGELGAVAVHVFISAAFARARLEGHGFRCRIPGKTGMEIDFEYSHLSTNQRSDPEMAEHSARRFAELKF